MPSPAVAATDPVNELVVLVQSRHGLVAVEAGDAGRALEAVTAAAGQLGVPVFTWTATKGIVRLGQPAGVYGTAELANALSHIEAAMIPAVYAFEGIGSQLSDALRVQALKDALVRLSTLNAAIVLLDGLQDLPEPVRPLAAVVTLPTPTADDYRALVGRVLAKLGSRITVRNELAGADLDRFLRALRGFTLSEAERVVTRVIVEDGALAPADIERVVAEKQKSLKATGILEFCALDTRLEDIADLVALKAWLATRRAVIAEPARAAAAGLPFPRGVLLVGVPGCGKSMCAKAVAADWQLPLLKLDTSAIYDKFIGESEKRFLAAIRGAEQASPAVLWIDEIEKAFSANDSDGGTSARILGTFLSWLQERRGDVFVVATANDIGRLPPELVRKGRFDEIFFVDLPTPEVRETIFRLHLGKRKQPLDGFDLAQLAADTEGFSGAEIEQAVVSALYGVFANGGALTMAQLRAELARTRPLSATMGERIQSLRGWAQGRTVPAN